MAEKQNQNKKEQNSGIRLKQSEQSGQEPFFESGVDSGSLLQQMRGNPGTVMPAEVMHLQRTIGNQAVQRLVGRVQPRQSPPPPPRLAGVRLSNGVIQRALQVGPADDKYEQEAEKISGSLQLAPLTKPKSKQDENVAQIEAAPTISRLQRQPKVGSEGGVADKNLESRIRRSQSSGSTMPSDIRNTLEPKLNADLSSVKVHTDSNSAQLNRELGAKAFTHKNHIYYGAGQSPGNMSLTAHEAVHTIQQGAVKQVARHYDDEKAETSVQRSSPNRIQRFFGFGKKKRAKKKAKAQKEKQRKEDLKEDLKYGVQYERNLGKYLFNHSKANAAARTLNQKMVSVLIPEFDETDEGHQEQLSSNFGGSKTKYAGSVGTEFADVWGVFQSGNLRERMTAIYNSLFGGFKKLVTELIKTRNWDEADKRGLDRRKLRIRRRQLGYGKKGFFGRNFGTKKDSYSDKGDKEIFRDPRNPLDQKKLKWRWKLWKTGTRDQKSDKAEELITDRTVGELDTGKHKAGLSERERKFMFPEKDKTEDISEERLAWEEGGSKWNMRDRSPWVKKIRDELKMPLTAGPSGTAQRFYQVWEWLSKPVPATDLRLALLGWMLVENDHSFHEIMDPGTDYGLSYTPGQKSYQDIDPLKPAELRENVCADPKYPGLFPDEISYYSKIEDNRYKLMAPYEEDMQKRTEHSPLLQDQTGLDKGQYERSGLRHHMKMVTAYTTLAYQLVNLVTSSKPFIAKMRIKSLMKRARQHLALEESAQNEDFEKMNFAERNMAFILEENPDITVDEIIAEAKEHGERTKLALKELPKFEGTVYRGEANALRMPYKKGGKIRFNKFTSTSRNDSYAVDYAKSSGGIDTDEKGVDTKRWYAKYMKPVILKIESKTGRDVNAVTVNESKKVAQKKKDADLDEVVFLPGTELEVTTNAKVDSSSSYGDIPVVKLKEIRSGTDTQESTYAGATFDVVGGKETEESEEDSPQTLEIYARKDEGTGGKFVDKMEADYLDEPEDMGDGWTRVTYLLEGSWYYCKTDEYAKFMNKSPAVSGEDVVPEETNPLKGLLTPPEKGIETFTFTDSSGMLDAPVSIEILEENYKDREGWERVQIKLGTGDFVMVYAEDLHKYFESSVKSEPSSPPPMYDHLPNGKVRITIAKDVELTVYSSENGDGAKQHTFDEETSARVAIFKDKGMGRLEFAGKYLWIDLKTITVGEENALFISAPEESESSSEESHEEASPIPKGAKPYYEDKELTRLAGYVNKQDAQDYMSNFAKMKEGVYVYTWMLDSMDYCMSLEDLNELGVDPT